MTEPDLEMEAYKLGIEWPRNPNTGEAMPLTLDLDGVRCTWQCTVWDDVDGDDQPILMYADYQTDTGLLLRVNAVWLEPGADVYLGDTYIGKAHKTNIFIDPSGQQYLAKEAKG